MRQLSIGDRESWACDSRSRARRDIIQKAKGLEKIRLAVETDKARTLYNNPEGIFRVDEQH